jgi:hypothetical protein
MKLGHVICGAAFAMALAAAFHGAAPSAPNDAHAPPRRSAEHVARSKDRRVVARELIGEDPAFARGRAVAWIRQTPALAETRAAELIGELARAGHSELAVGIALQLDSPAGPLELALAIQATTDPLAAWAIVETIADASLRSHARETVLARGSDAFLPQLAAYARSVASPALASVLSRWALQDPAALSSWLNEHEVPPHVRDLAASHLVLHGDSENRSPEVAAEWAASISDAALRHEAMQAAAAEQAADP